MSKKDKSKKRKAKKTAKQILGEYARTVGISFLLALIFTLLLSFHAKNEMIKNFYQSQSSENINKFIAQQLIEQSGFLKDLNQKSFSLCMHAGNIYFSAQDYANAQEAYETAVQKAPSANFSAHGKLVKVLLIRDEIDEAKNLIKSVKDTNNKGLIKFKSQAFTDLGDKYYSAGKFLNASKSYERALFYYDKFSKNDRKIRNSIITKLIDSYDETADVFVKNGYNTDAVRYLKKAGKLAPDNFKIKYKLAIIYTDLDPLIAINYFEEIIKENPHKIDSGVYTKALMKSANIRELEGKTTEAKRLRYKIHSLDLFLNRKVVYKNDIDIYLNKFSVKKFQLRYRIKASFRFKNASANDINNLFADFVLKRNGKVSEKITVQCAEPKKKLYSNGGVTDEINIKFGKHIFTKKELNQYTIEIYLYKDPKFKTHAGTLTVPPKMLNDSTF